MFRYAQDDPLSKEEVAHFLKPFSTSALAIASKLGLDATIHTRKPWTPKLHNGGVDINLLVNTPAMRKAVLSFAWKTEASDSKWQDLTASAASPTWVTLLWNDTYYRAFGIRLALFLKTLAALGQTRPRPPNTTPFNTVASLQICEMLKVAVQTELAKPVKITTEEGNEEERSLTDEEKLAKLKDLSFLQSVLADEDLKAAVKNLGATGVARVFAPDLDAILEGSYTALDYEQTLKQLAAKLSRSKFRGEAGAAYTPSGLVVVGIEAPFRVLLACRRGSGTTLSPLMAGLDIGTRVLTAPPAAGEELTMGALALGLAALQARRGPEQAVKRGRLALALDPGEASEIRAASPPIS